MREKDLSDVSDDYDWRTDVELAKLDATRPLGMSYDDFYRYSKEDLTQPSMRSKRLAIHSIGGKHIGNCMFYDIDLRDGEAEVGIMLGDKDYWGQGYGTEAMGVLLDHMFTAYPFNRIYLHTLTWNRRALNSFRDLWIQRPPSDGFRAVIYTGNQSYRVTVACCCDIL